MYGLRPDQLSHDGNLVGWAALCSICVLCGLIEIGILTLIKTHIGNLSAGKTTCERFGFNAQQKQSKSVKESPQNLTREQADQEAASQEEQPEVAQIGSTLSSDLHKFGAANGLYQNAESAEEEAKPVGCCGNFCLMWFGNAANPVYEDTRLSQLKR